MGRIGSYPIYQDVSCKWAHHKRERIHSPFFLKTRSCHPQKLFEVINEIVFSLGRRKGGRGRGRRRKKYKHVADLDSIKEHTGWGSPSLIACPECLEKSTLLCIINYGEDNFTDWAVNGIIAICPVCGFERPREDNAGDEWWIPFHLPGVQKRLEKITERRLPQSYDATRFTKRNYG